MAKSTNGRGERKTDARPNVESNRRRAERFSSWPDLMQATRDAAWAELAPIANIDRATFEADLESFKPKPVGPLRDVADRLVALIRDGRSLVEEGHGHLMPDEVREWFAEHTWADETPRMLTLTSERARIIVQVRAMIWPGATDARPRPPLTSRTIALCTLLAGCEPDSVKSELRLRQGRKDAAKRPTVAEVIKAETRAVRTALGRR